MPIDANDTSLTGVAANIIALLLSAPDESASSCTMQSFEQVKGVSFLDSSHTPFPQGVDEVGWHAKRES